jgi:hypothetical protein
MIEFSIILVSRSRPSMLFDLYDSLDKTCGLPHELIVGMDLDDKTGGEYICAK